MVRPSQNALNELPADSGRPLTIFLGGVHGAGKSTIGSQTARLVGASYVTAGGLIKQTAGQDYEATAGFKSVPNVDANQMLLLSGLSRFRAKNKGPLLLDGHFVLLKSSGAIAEIPIEVYDAIAPVAAVLIEAAPETVHARLFRRDGERLPITTIAELARRERLHTERICENLGIPLKAVSSDGTIAEAVAMATSIVRELLEGQL